MLRKIKKPLKKASHKPYDKNMNPDLPTPQVSQPNSPAQPPTTFLSKRNILILLMSLVLIIGGVWVFLKLNSKPTPPAPLKPSQEAVKPDKVIAKVGAESIYQLDLDIELAYYPANRRESHKKYLLDKIITDSIILQAGEAEKLIQLDATTFNSLHKEYLKRIALVEEVKKKVTEQEDGISGTVITMYFANNEIGSLGYEKSKEIVKNKITKLHDEVVSKKITVQQAAKIIQNDSSLAQIDKAYKTNAFFDFKVERNEAITRDTAFNNALHQLKEGAVSDLFIGKDVIGSIKDEIEVKYHFGQINKTINNGKITNFDNWVSQKRQNYEIIYY